MKLCKNTAWSTNALGDLGVAVNGTGFKKAKSMKSQQQKRDRGLSFESAWTGRCYLQELISCLLKHLVISASDVDSDIPIKTETCYRKERCRVPWGERLGAAWHNSSGVWIAFACSVSCPMTGWIRDQTLVHFVSPANRKAFHCVTVLWLMF